VSDPLAPRVSVLLPVRDAAAYLPQAITSIESQTLAALEVIAVDDGSQDHSSELLDAWAERDDRVRVVRQAASGIIPALNRSRAEARAPFLARMDADDVAAPGRLEAQLALMTARPEVVACGTLVEYFPKEHVRDGARRYERWLNAARTPEEIERSLFVECPLAHPTFFLRADAFDAVGGYRDRGWPEDYDLLLRLWAAGGTLAKVPEVLLQWREGEGRLSRTHRRYAPEAFRRCKVHHLRTAVLDARPVVVWGAGPVGKAMSRALRRVGVDLEAFVELDPRKIGQEIHGAPVLDTAGGLERRRAYHLAAVGRTGARTRLVGLLEDAGYAPVRDFVAVA
jgi:glycosyltransferase involved in cell wall biosynthesis